MAGRIAVVGAGWSGLAAAFDLAGAGRPVDLFEAAPQAGGRGRGLNLALDGHDFELDNGQHLIVGAYRDTLSLIRRAGAADQASAMPMSLSSTAGLSLRAPRLPAPFHLLAAAAGARGLSLASRWSMGKMMTALRLRGWHTADSTVAQLLRSHRQPADLVDAVWSPLCVATMNTATDQACAQTFVNVLRDTLGGPRAASDFVVTQASLTRLFVDPLVRGLRQAGGRLYLRRTVRSVSASDGAWALDTDEGPAHGYRHLLLAVPPPNAARLIGSLAGVKSEPARARLQADLAAFDYEPIATVYLWWPARVLRDAGRSLPTWIQLHESAARRDFGQWLFARGEQHGHVIASVVVSTAARVLDSAGGTGLDRDGLGACVADQVSRQLALPAPSAHRTLVEKRATFRCTPARPRLRHDSARALADRLWLAGDYAWPDYPATLEGAVRSGRAAARACIDSP